MIEALKYVNLKEELTPNQYYLLWCIHNKEDPENINVALEERILINAGKLNEDRTIPQHILDKIIYIDALYTVKLNKRKTYLIGEEHIINIKKYREMFPTGRLPSGSLARQSEKELYHNFIWFFQTYPQYNWDAIFKATERYIDRFAGNYFGMRTSKYFIVKEDPSTKLKHSDLADECRDMEEDQQDNNHGYTYTVG